MTEKIKWTKPVLTKLNSIDRMAADCSNGSGNAVNCSEGTSAGGCAIDNSASSSCTDGSSAPVGMCFTGTGGS